MDPFLQNLQSRGIKVVESSGPPSQLAIIGEALGQQEELNGVPFYQNAPAGWMFSEICRNVGIQRETCFISNVVPIRPPNNDLDRLSELGLSVSAFLPSLKARLERVKPNCVLALGKTALYALCGKDEIASWRGSILESTLVPGLKVIPTFHPSFVNRMGDDPAKKEITGARGSVKYDYGTSRISMSLDMRRAVDQSRTPDLPKEDFHIEVVDDPSVAVVRIRDLSRRKVVSFDIETIPDQGIITRMGLCGDNDYAVSFPIDSPQVQESLRELFWNHKGLVAQNGIYDMSYLMAKGMPVRILHFDTRLAHHRIYIELPHSLEFLTSVYTLIPYYKHMSEFNMPRYNGLDALGTFRVYLKLMEELIEFNEVDNFFGFTMPLLHTTARMGWRGMLIDKKKMEEIGKQLDEEIEKRELKLKEQAGFDLNVRSSKQMKEWVYEKLKLPIQYHRKTGKPTLDEDALLKLAKSSGNDALKTVIDIREVKTLKSNFVNKTLDFDGRWCTQYGVAGTDIGRLNSTTTPWNTGANLQNIPRSKQPGLGGLVRKCFVPDPGMILMAFDLEQSDARFVAYLSRDDKAKEIFRSGKDIHKWNATIITGKVESAISDNDRYFAKRCVHAINYKLGPKHLADIIFRDLKQDCSVGQAKEYIRKYQSGCPALLQWHEEISNIVKATRTLITPLGRRRVFFGRISDDLFRKAIAYIPAACTVDYLNLPMIRIEIRLAGLAKLLLQVHDEIVLETSPQNAVHCFEVVKEEMDNYVEIHGDKLKIPIEAKVGLTWGDGQNAKTVGGLVDILRGMDKGAGESRAVPLLVGGGSDK